MVDELAPASGEEVPTWSTAVDVPKPPRDAVDVSDGEELDRRIGAEIERREDRVGTEARHREATAVVGVGGREDFGERNDAVLALALLVVGLAVAVVVLVVVVERVREWSEEEPGEDLVGERISEQITGGHKAGNEGEGTEGRGERM